MDRYRCLYRGVYRRLAARSHAGRCDGYERSERGRWNCGQIQRQGAVMASQKAWDGELQMFVEPGTVDRKRLAHLRHLALTGGLADDGARLDQVVASRLADGLKPRVCTDKSKKCGICVECLPDEIAEQRKTK